MLKYESIDELVKAAEQNNMSISELVLKDQADSMEVSAKELYDRMQESYEVMKESVAQGMKKDQKSMSGLTGGEAYKVNSYSERTGGGLCGSFMSGAIARSLAAAGCNASMGRIVAAPTGGSCGILPGCLISLQKEHDLPEEKVVMSMFTAGAIGMVIAAKASIAGAEGGCQAECGSASAMAAAAMVELMGGTPSQCADACAIAISSQMGLVCDPVAGLVEIPCIKRNASGVMIAFSSAEIALADVGSRIPADECLDAMREVGNALPASLKETAGGGLATTPTGITLKKQIFGTETE